MGLPQIMIKFKTAGGTAIRRSARGQVVLMMPGETGTVSFSRLEQADRGQLGEEAWLLLQLCFLGNPAKVHLVYYAAGEESAALAGCSKLAEGGWLCAPAMEAQQVTGFIRTCRSQGKPLRAVVSTEESPNCEGIVNFTTQGITLRLEEESVTVTAAQYCARIAGILAGISLRESATYYPLTEVEGFTAHADPEGDIAQGRLILDRGSESVRLARAVTSLVSSGESAFRKIKITEGMDLIQADIRSVFESEYVGKVLNDYDSKLLLVTAVNSYFASLEGSVLDTGHRSQASVDLEAQRAFLESQGVDTESMSDTAILSANTGSQVFLRADVRFADAMEDLTFEIAMQ